MFSKIPRGRPYLRPIEACRALARHLPRGLVRGARTATLERAFAAYTGAECCYALPQARVAIYHLLRVLDLPAGSEVVTTPITIPDVVNAVLAAGLRPVFADLSPRTCNLDADNLERRIGPRTRALLVTHLCGFPTDMDRVMHVADRHGLVVLEDASQSVGATWRGRPVGRFGRAGVFSLSALKPVSSFAGGLVITDDAALDAALRQATSGFPVRPRRDLLPLAYHEAVYYTMTQRVVFSAFTYYVACVFERFAPGPMQEMQRGNLPLTRFQPTLRRDHLPESMMVRYSDCQAELALAALARVDDEIAWRRELAAALHARLQARGVPGLPCVPSHGASVFWRFPLWLDPPGRLRAFLFSRHVDTGTSGLPCLSREPAFAEFAAHTPEAFRFVDAAVFLPLHPTLSRRDIEYVADGVCAWFDGGWP